MSTTDPAEMALLSQWATLPILRGQRAVITGAATGIGRAIADLLIGQGCAVLICDVSEAALTAFGTAHPEAFAVRGDVSSAADLDAVFAAARKNLGGLDLLVNNAGIAGPTARIEAMDEDDWRRCIDIDLTGQFMCAKRAVPMLRESPAGSIVNISSVAGRFGYAFRTPYASAKYGLIGLTESLAKELGPDGIRVNAVLPGIVEGPRIRAVIKGRAEQLGLSEAEVETQYLDKISMHRMVEASDVANMVAFLASPMARLVSGQSIAVCGNVETL